MQDDICYVPHTWSGLHQEEFLDMEILIYCELP